MTEENRKLRIKEVFRYMEDSKVALRNIRQDLLKTEKAKKENGEISEDDLKRFEDTLQKEIDQLNKELESMAKEKEVEMLKV